MGDQSPSKSGGKNTRQASVKPGAVTDPYGLELSEFPKELAEFITFIGDDYIDKAWQKVDRKLRSPEAQSFFDDRFHFHEQWVRFT
jgi:hypothetical protein